MWSGIKQVLPKLFDVLGFVSRAEQEAEAGKNETRSQLLLTIKVSKAMFMK